MNQSKNKEYTISLRNKYIFVPEEIEVKKRKVICYSWANKNSYATYYVEADSSEASSPKYCICLPIDNQIDVFITHNDYEYFKKFDKNIFEFSGLKIQHENGMVCMNIIIDIPINSLNKTSFLTEKIYELLPSAFIYDGEIPERKLRNDITLVIDSYLDENFTTIDFLGFCKFFDPNLSEFENEDQKRCFIIKSR